jgi:tetratricopeptide (TPR) repeat protein
MQTIRDLFDKLSEMEANKRDNYLAAHPELPDSVVQSVRELLQADETIDSLPPLNGVDGTDRQEIAAEFSQGDMLGRYRIVRRLGAGGTGVVYEAMREDDGIRLRVAIKLLHRELCIPECLANLRHEAEALAQLRHPQIARMLDWNFDVCETSYCVLDLIEGEPITTWCASKSLSVIERLKLFLELCDVVAYAHQHMIGHFDLKPQNVLVNQTGEVRLIDFSIARVFTQKSQTDKAEYETRGFSPRYASPEQKSGEMLTLRSDIYSLGIMLREILGSGFGIEVSAHARSRVLEAIASRAAASDPEHRYETVERLKRDVENYMCNLPVRAVPPDKMYRTRLFLRRNRLHLALCMAAVLVFGVGLDFWHISRKAAAERHRSEQLSQTIHEFSNTLLGPLQDQVRNSPGATPVRMMLVRTGVMFLNNLTAQSQSSPAISEELARAYTALGDIQGNPSGPNIGDEAGAKASYEAARRLLSQQITHHNQLSYGLLLTHEGDLIGDEGDHQRAKQMYAEAIRALTAYKPTNADQLTVQEDLISAYNDLGDEQAADRNVVDARANYNHALAIARQLRDLHPESITYQRAFARTQSRFGDLESNVGHWQAAADAYSQTFAIYERLLSQNPETPRVRHSWIAGANNLALAYEHLNRSDEALVLYQRVNVVAVRNAKQDQNNTAAQRDLQVSDSNLGRVYMVLGNIKAAEDANRDEVTLAQSYLKQNPQDGLAREDLADALEYTAKIQARKHNFSKAMMSANQVLQLVRTNLQSESDAHNLGQVVEALTRRANYCVDDAAVNPVSAKRDYSAAEKDLAELRTLEPRLNSTYEEDKEKAKNIEKLAVRLQAIRAR